MTDSDIVIAGGGMAGISLALLLARRTKFSVRLIEAFRLPPIDTAPAAPSFNARSMALSAASLAIYDTLGLAEKIQQQAAPIRTVDVSMRGRPGRTRLTAQEMQVPQLGAVIENRLLGRLLLAAAAEEPAIELHSPARITAADRLTHGYRIKLDNDQTMHCRLLIVADGSRSTTRDLLGIAAHHDDSGEAALVLNVGVKNGHQAIGWERFLESGPLAFLPLPAETADADERMTVVWTGKKAFVDELAALPEDSFRQVLQAEAERLGITLGQLGTRSTNPLIATRVAAQAIPHAVVVGNAAHTLHPVAAQGFNLSLRDLDCLATCLADTDSPGELAVLEAYEAKRQLDQAIIGRASRWLPDTFRVRFAPFAHARQLGLMALAVFPGLRQAFTHRAMGG